MVPQVGSYWLEVGVGLGALSQMSNREYNEEFIVNTR